jgi:hypothetical protein
VGITAALLARPRVTAFVAVGIAVYAWFLVAPHLGRIGLWPAILLVSVVITPMTLALVLIALPLWDRRWLIVAVIALALVALLCTIADLGLAANFAKLWAAVFAGWAFLRYFERLSWVVLVAFVIPLVDIVSVYAGPTKMIVTNHFGVYKSFAIAFLVPGGGAAYLGPPDILFYALFLAAAARWNLRVGWTWLATTFMYGLTVIVATLLDVGGLPALPFLSFGFLVANADLLWRAMRPSADSSESSPASS